MSVDFLHTATWSAYTSSSLLFLHMTLLPLPLPLPSRYSWSRLFYMSVEQPTINKCDYYYYYTVTGNLAVISHFHLFQINERHDFFSFFETLFYTKLPFPLPWWSKDLLVDKHAGGGQSTSKSTCEVPARTLTAYLAIDQHPACPNRGRLEPWPRKWFLLGQNPWR